jgi:hypothetical protein
MPDWRLQSGHLAPTRRELYRRSREGALAARGWLTLAVERVERWNGESADQPSGLPIRAGNWLPGVRLALIEQQTGAWYPLKTGLNTIGRFPENDIVFEERYISRRHCVILVHVCGNCELHDTASMNGTFVNGKRVHRPVSLARGDHIRICNRLLVVAGTDNDQPAADDALDQDLEYPRTMIQE